MFYFCTISLNVGVLTTFHFLHCSAERKKKKKDIEGVLVFIAKIKINSYLWKALLSTLAWPEYIKSPVLTTQHLRKRGLMLLDEG